MQYMWDISNPATYNNRSGWYKFQRQRNFILRHGADHLGRILDIAGGSGRYAVELERYCNDITVVDIDPTALELLKSRSASIKTIESDFLDCRLSPTFSLILCIEAIFYFQDWKRFFLKAQKLLDVDGRFIITYTNPRSWRYFLRKLANARSGTIAYHEMPYTDFLKLLSGCGLEVEAVEGMNWIPLRLSSNSRLVTLCVAIEGFLGLKHWVGQSPWLLLCLRKTA